MGIAKPKAKQKHKCLQQNKQTNENDILLILFCVAVRRLCRSKVLSYLQFSYLHAAVRIFCPSEKPMAHPHSRPCSETVPVCLWPNGSNDQRDNKIQSDCCTHWRVHRSRHMRGTVLAIDAMLVVIENCCRKRVKVICANDAAALRLFSLLLFSTICTHEGY